jgi:hypothetical protein
MEVTLNSSQEAVDSMIEAAVTTGEIQNKFLNSK